MVAHSIKLCEPKQRPMSWCMCVMETYKQKKKERRHTRENIYNSISGSNEMPNLGVALPQQIYSYNNTGVSKLLCGSVN